MGGLVKINAYLGLLKYSSEVKFLGFKLNVNLKNDSKK